MGRPTIGGDLDRRLRDQIEQTYLTEGQLFGMVPQSALTVEQRQRLLSAGWTSRNFVDAPMMEPPMLEIRWPDLKSRHRDATMHCVYHRVPAQTPWIGNRVEILEEMLGSAWEAKEDELRTVLSAWCYASAWTGPAAEPEANQSLESSEVFFFYTEPMRTATLRILQEGAGAPDDTDTFWDLLDALVKDD